MTAVAYGLSFPATRGVLGVPVPAPLDAVTGVSITGAWSLTRRLLTSYGGGNRFRVRDTTTAGEQDCVTPDDAFLGGHGGTVAKLYDQSGNVRTLSNTTAAQQPAFATGIGANARAGMTFDASDDVLSGGTLSNYVSATGGYFVGVASISTDLSDTVPHGRAIVSDTSAIVGVYYANSSLYGDGQDGGRKDTAGIGQALSTLFSFEWWLESGTLHLRVNGASEQTASCGALSSTAGNFLAGKRYSATAGDIMEVASMSAQPAQADAVVADMMAYYGIA
jgi:hypothetical protein